jgi:hypothetical protein
MCPPLHTEDRAAISEVRLIRTPDRDRGLNDRNLLEGVSVFAFHQDMEVRLQLGANAA